MVLELADLCLPVFSAIGLGALLAPFRAPATIPAAASVFCDCPSTAPWLAGGLVIGLVLGAAAVCVGAALLRPAAQRDQRAPPRPQLWSEEVYQDAVEVLIPPRAAYRRR